MLCLCSALVFIVLITHEVNCMDMGYGGGGKPMMMGGNCGRSTECRKLSLRCSALLNGVDSKELCATQDKMEGSLQRCVADLKMQEQYTSFYDSEGQYILLPYHHFMKQLRMADPTAEKNLRCCCLKADGTVNESGMVNKEVLMKTFLKRAGDDKMLTEALNVAQKQCPQDSDCNLDATMKCFMDQCVQALNV